MNVERGLFLTLGLFIYLLIAPHEPCEAFTTMKKLSQ